MAGQITHSWNGTVLTITSDSGTSSCDLKGGTGDRGIRGPQGEPGIVILDGLTPEQLEQIKGKSAYQYAKEGGYTGTEEEYAQDINPTNITNAVLANFTNVAEVAL